MDSHEDRDADRASDEPICHLTPEMIAAGAKELLRWDDRVDTREAAAERVFRAMMKASSLSL